MQLRYTVDVTVDPNGIEDGLPERIVRDEIASNLEGQKYVRGCYVQPSQRSTDMGSTQRAAATEDNTDEQTTSHTNRPTVLFDDGHGTKVKLWNNRAEGGKEYQNIAIERSF